MNHPAAVPLLLDDAAVFPPGNLPLAEAVVAHRAHRASWYADLVGPLVVPAAALDDLVDEGPLDVAVVAPLDQLATVLAWDVPGIRVVAVEVTLPSDLPADAVLAELGRRNSRLDEEASSSKREFHRPAGETPVFVEIPRDERRDAVIADLAGSSYRAKLRTGGVRADLYPDEAELAAAVVALTRAGVPFKATAGLHHALRNTDPETGFEQHGFLNLLAATAAAEAGAGVEDVAALLAIRDADRLPATTGSLLGSIGTCSITDPVDELTALGRLLEASR
ncbi:MULTISPECIES: hypothetical protein [unclassified Nocardioides]|uniref:hypothetical protein n=1 Tax=unclassified Nocardioides TaxID=2615069 RepID=UPI00070350B2|nr:MULTISPECIES: hypothetical protein [unclassified Nocardioides]KRC53054.1 hypothetical protein ASE19_11740 [Nocardioides sp. Root79]KRC72583.1 hypothetical protein ASE20_08270 [Nocardioides sp. Root240]